MTLDQLLFDLATGWMTLLFGLGVAALLRDRSPLGRILVLDTLTLILLSLLALFTIIRRVSYYMDAALVLALLSFAATLAAAKYYSEGNPFS